MSKDIRLQVCFVPKNLATLVVRGSTTQIIGTWNELKQKLDDLAEKLEVQELLISTGQEGFETRIQLYEKLAEIYQLKKY